MRFADTTRTMGRLAQRGGTEECYRCHNATIALEKTVSDSVHKRCKSPHHSHLFVGLFARLRVRGRQVSRGGEGRRLLAVLAHGVGARAFCAAHACPRLALAQFYGVQHREGNLIQ